MNKGSFQILLCASLVCLVSTLTSAQTSEFPKGCSEHAQLLLKKAWAAQPMNVKRNNADPAKAEALSKEAIKDSPKCGPANNFLVVLLLRNHDYQQANVYNERFLGQVPDDPTGLNLRADLISATTKDHALALEIRMNLLKVKDFNNNGALFYDIAGTYSLMNKSDESLEYLRLAMSISKGWGNRANAQVHPDFENVRKDKRFWSLVNQK